MSNTSFARWRAKMDWTQEQCARTLGVALRTVQHWDSGKTSAGADSAPPYAVRLAMAALLKNPELEPWPEGLEAKVVDLARRRK
jgi:DNA-binding XRE family transcriptional regulator